MSGDIIFDSLGEGPFGTNLHAKVEFFLVFVEPFKYCIIDRCAAVLSVQDSIRQKQNNNRQHVL
jgi:hypothetical protein